MTHPPPDEPTGRRVARLRRRRGLTRQQFADLCGKSVSWVDKVERGERALARIPMLERAAGVLGVTIEALIGGPGPGVPNPPLDAFEVADIRAALQRFDAFSTVFTDRAAGAEPSLSRVRQQVDYAWTAFQQGHYYRLGRLLPSLLYDAQAAVSNAAENSVLDAKAQLSRAYQVTASTLWKVKEVELGWLAAERSLLIAEQTSDVLLVSDAARRVAQGLMASGHGDQALRLLRADIDRLEPGLGSASPAYLSLYGMLFLLGSVVAARLGDNQTANTFHREATAVGARLGGDRNEHWTAFGPTNVAVHRVAALVDLGEGRAAIDTARTISPYALAALPRERRAALYLDTACGAVQASDHDAAVTALLQVDQLAPDELRCRPVATTLIHDLLRRRPGKASSSLQQLAHRVGLT